jgi:hypothetical protein
MSNAWMVRLAMLPSLYGSVLCCPTYSLYLRKHRAAMPLRERSPRQQRVMPRPL